MPPLRFFATAAKNLESLLAEELRGLGLSEVSETRGGARFRGGLADAYRACLWSRVANRVLMPLAEFPAETPEALYAGAQTIRWPTHFDPGQSFAVSCHTAGSAITHSHYAALKVKDAIADNFRELCGVRPSVATTRPDIAVDVYILRDRVTISLDLSGESLHRRGYRSGGTAAPLKENLAAALLLRAGWPAIAAAGGAFVDPMCGSGTLPIEAALIAADIAPGLHREHWGFLGWKQHQEGAWRRLLEEAETRRELGLANMPPVHGDERDAASVRVARGNVEQARLGQRVQIRRRDLAAQREAESGPKGLVVVNPPYGERLGAGADLPALYAKLGTVLKTCFPQWRAAVLTAEPELGRKLGLRAQRMHTLYNGPIECKLLHFDVAPAHYLTSRPRALAVQTGGPGAEMLANRLKKNRRHLARWLKREDIRCYRLYDADLPEYAVAVDVYEGRQTWVHVQEYAPPPSVDERKASRHLREALGAIGEVLDTPQDQIFFKVRRRQRGAAQYERLADTGHFHEVREGGWRFLVNFEDYLDTGLFLDQRSTRAMLARMAEGQHFLNLFAYTGAASIYAAKGGALSTTSVDMSKTYTEWARRNLTLNGLDNGRHEVVRADCLKWLAQAGEGTRRFGLIFLDPPSFSSSKRMEKTLDVQRDHAALISATTALLAPGGTLVFSNNLRRFRMDRQALDGFVLEDISRSTLPRDFERNPRMHHCWKIKLA